MSKYLTPVRPSNMAATDISTVSGGMGAYDGGSRREILVGDVQDDGVDQREGQGGEAQTQGELEETPASEECQPARSATIPTKPSTAEVEAHRETHLPYRSWCEHCVRGRALGVGHPRKGLQSAIPVVALDYFFMTKSSLMTPDECRNALQGGMDEALEKGEIVKCLMVKCSMTKAEMAVVVNSKGQDRYAVNRIVAFIQWIGHTRLVMKSDNERAVVALVREALRDIRIELDVQTATEEHSPAYDSQCNGMIENAIKNNRGLFRTLRSCLQSRIGRKVEVDHPLMAWLIEHTSILRCAMVRGDDGMTPWNKCRGRPFNMATLCFGERCHFKLPTKGPFKEKRGNMNEIQEDGIFLGYSTVSNEYVYANAKGICTSRSVTRRPEDERWSIEMLASLRATPANRHEHRGQGRGLEAPNEEAPAVQPAERIPVRAFKIMKRYLENPNVGYTPGCEQCEYIRRHGSGRPGITHNETCRERVMARMAETEEGREIVEATEQRITRALADHVERHAQADPGPASAELPPAWPAAGCPVDENPFGSGQEAPVQREEPSDQAQGDEQSGTRHVEDPAPEDVDMDDQNPDMDVGHINRLGRSAVSPLMSQAWRNGEDAATERYIGLIDFTTELMVSQMGGCGKSYARERKAALTKCVSEVYSPPRISALAKDLPSYGIQPGFALDLTTYDVDGREWDFNHLDMRKRARRLVEETKPLFLIGSPMCRAFSTWQYLNRAKQGKEPEEVRREMARATMHVDFMAELMELQIGGDRFFLYEHPAYATSWECESIKRLMKFPGVNKVVSDQCQHGLRARRGAQQGDPIKKPTGFMSNSEVLLKELQRRCTGKKGLCSNGRKHAPCSGGNARDAQVYSRELCEAVLRGMQAQLRQMGMLQSGILGIQSASAEWEHDELLICEGPRQGFSGKHRDDLTGQVLKDSFVEDARKKELEYFEKKQVWERVDKALVRSKGHKIVSTRWVDVNKGDNACPNYRSRLVARQLKAHDKSGTVFFAPTPPLEALRTVLSRTTTRSQGEPAEYRDPTSERRLQISTVDISRAYFNAKTDPNEPVYVCLPSEDPDSNLKVGLLRRHMYGTRRAADGWQEEYSSCLVEALNFEQGSACPCVFYNRERDLLCSVHGDDFTTRGPKEQLDWFEQKLAENYELKVGPRLGAGEHDAKEATVLNRVIRWTETGIELEADPRQIERLLQENGLEGANSVCSPGIRASAAQVLEDEALPDKYHTAFRAAAARANYMAQDRPDCQFACKEICRWMAKPTNGSFEALKRLCRFLVGAPRLVWKYNLQESSGISIYSDTDWAGCPRTRKSTSGGCILVGTHLIKTWSSTQASVALSSGEAEFYGVVKASGAGLGYQALMRDFGVDLPVTVYTDSTATIGISSRQGLGKLRHLDTTALWIQQAIRSKRITLRKVAGEENPADLFTKHMATREKLAGLVKLFECEYRGGRAASAPQLRREQRQGVEIKEADVSVNHVGIEVLPHNMDGDELEAFFPCVVAAPELEVYEAELHGRNFLEEAGLKIAEAIEAEAKSAGRRRIAIPDVRKNAEGNGVAKTAAITRTLTMT